MHLNLIAILENGQVKVKQYLRIPKEGDSDWYWDVENDYKSMYSQFTYHVHPDSYLECACSLDCDVCYAS